LAGLASPEAGSAGARINLFPGLEVPELIRVADDPDRVDPTLSNAKGHDGGGATGLEPDDTGQPVNCGPAHIGGRDVVLAGCGDHRAGDHRGSLKGAEQGARLVAAIGDQDDVFRHPREHGLEVTVAYGRQERCDQLVGLRTRGVESWAAVLDPLARPREDLASVLLRLVDDARDVGELTPEAFSQNEDRPFDRAQCFQENQEGEGKRIR